MEPLRIAPELISRAIETGQAVPRGVTHLIAVLSRFVVQEEPEGRPANIQHFTTSPDTDEPDVH